MIRFFVPYIVNNTSTKAESSSQISATHFTLASFNDSYLHFIKDAFMVIKAFFNFYKIAIICMFNILRISAPLKIVEFIIQFVPVYVINTWQVIYIFYKKSCYNIVNRYISFDVVFAKAKHQIPTIRHKWLDILFVSFAVNSAIIRNKVIGVIFDWLKDFFHNSKIKIPWDVTIIKETPRGSQALNNSYITNINKIILC